MNCSAQGAAGPRAAAPHPVVRPPTAAPQVLGWPRRPRLAPSVAAAAAGQDDPPENPQLQDTLVSMIRLEIGKKEVEDYVVESGDKLKQVADEAKEEMERLAELSRLRSEVAFDSALADINREADEFEEQLRRSREAAAASEREFESWEAGVAASRSEGQFFKTLYQRDAATPAGQSAEELRARAAKVVEPARAEVSSSLRANLYFVLSFLLAAQVGADVASADPSVGPDLLYSSLAALAVWLAVNERRGLP